MPKNRQIVLTARPEPGPLQPQKLFALKETEVAEPKSGEVLVRIEYLSLDPTMRGWMTYDTYLPAVAINSVMRGLGVGTVVSSQSAKFKAGDKVQAMTGWQEMALLNEKEVTRVHLPAGVTLTDHLSMSLTGLTAMVGIYKVGKGEFKKGGTVLVSGAAGSTGGFAGQVYRNALGCRVVGTAGGPEKCRFVKEVLGFDECVDYKEKDWEKKLRAACKGGIEEYFDNVGGRTLELALEMMNLNGRVVLCGGISQYDSAKPMGPSNYLLAISKRLRMEGFVFTDHARSFPEFYKNMHAMIAEKKLKIVTDERKGLENTGEALRDLFAGKNIGKLCVKL